VHRSGFLGDEFVEGRQQAAPGLAGRFHQATPCNGIGAAESRLLSISASRCALR